MSTYTVIFLSRKHWWIEKEIEATSAHEALRLAGQSAGEGCIDHGHVVDCVMADVHPEYDAWAYVIEICSYKASRFGITSPI